MTRGRVNEPFEWVIRPGCVIDPIIQRDVATQASVHIHHVALRYFEPL
jgi:hypothetical protein